MTPKEKAKELLQNFNNIQIINGTVIKPNIEITQISLRLRKKIALIAVEEILNTLYSIPFGNALDNELEYWEEVKQELKNK